MRTAPARGQQGVALVAILLALALFSALGLAILLSSAQDRLAAANHDESLHLVNAAESALELTAQELGLIADWNSVLDGTRRSVGADGAPDGPRLVGPALHIDLTHLTNRLTCGRVTACSDVDVSTSTYERPWGRNNPRWKPFLYGHLGPTDPLHTRAPYVVVWLGDDAAEVDEDVVVDGGGAGEEGRYLVRARAEAFGAGGGRRAIEAELGKICRPGEEGEVCLPGSRVQSWRVVTAALP